MVFLYNVWLGTSVEDHTVLDRIDYLRNTPVKIRFISFEPLIRSVAQADLAQIDWAIIGGESGPRARPMSIEWVDEVEDLCRFYGTAFFFKQWGGRDKKAAGGTLNGKIYDRCHSSMLFKYPANTLFL